MKIRSPRGLQSQTGMALIAVLWMVAALSVMVAGIVHVVRNEIRLVSGAREAVQASAWGDAAIHLVLQDMQAQTERKSRLSEVRVTYREQEISVQILPLNGLIDINQAEPALLASLFVVAAGKAPDAAQALAQAVVESRSRTDGSGRADGFEANEDLLRVPGLDYASYARIAGLVTADKPAGARVNPYSAPEAVLLVLAGGDAAQARRLAADRDAGVVGMDTTTLAADAIDHASTQRFRLQARVPLPSGQALLVARSVDFGDGAQDGLPWRTFHLEQRLEPALTTMSAKGH